MLSACVLGPFVLTALHKVWKWFQRAVEQAQDLGDHCGCPCRGRRAELAVYLHTRRLTTGIYSVWDTYLRVGKSSEVTPEHKGW